MAGMLPGVECARRRRIHQGGSTMESQSSGSRRSSFCLYTSSHEFHIGSNTLQRSFTTHSCQTDKLGDVAREAKERLDGRLRTQRKPEINRSKSTDSMGSKEENGGERFSSMIIGSLLREVFSSKKKSSSKKLSWTKLGSEASGQEECVVCLEGFKSGDLLVHLPCTHRYHSGCLAPWLRTNAHCPYCRTEILT